jgi:hypothetical protein
VRRTWTWLVAAGLTALMLALWPGPQTDRRRADQPVGTAGRAEVAEPEDSPATLHDLETMTGAVDQHALVGSHVDFHARVADVADSTSFWIGSKDNRVPVIAMTPVIAGQFVRITGIIDIHDQQVYIRAELVTPE